jgi:hypothetical protein
MGERDSVSEARRDVDPIAGSELAFRLTLQQQPCSASQYQNKFAFILVVPETRRRDLPARDDALDPDFRCPQEHRHQFIAQVGGYSFEEAAA